MQVCYTEILKIKVSDDEREKSKSIYETGAENMNKICDCY